MDSALYAQIMDDYWNLRSRHSLLDHERIVKFLIEKYCTADWGLREESVYSMINYEYQQEMRARLCESRNWPDLFRRWKEGDSLFSLVDQTGVSSALLGNKLLSQGRSEEDTKGTAVDSNQIDDGRIAYELMVSRYLDPFYGPFATFIARNVGTVLEHKVEGYLRKNGFQYLKEGDMRERNFDVTPDFKLDIPVVVDFADATRLSLIAYKPSSGCTKCTFDSQDKNGSEKHEAKNIVNWIECKSLFASLKCHQEYAKTQYSSYFNRFGRGLVIYGYGCVKEILADASHFIVLQNVQLE